MKKVLITLLAVFCLYSLAFALNPNANPNADPDEDWEQRMLEKSLLKPAPVKQVKSSGIPLAAGDYYIPKGSNALGFDSLHIAVDSINANGVTGTVYLILDADTLREPSFTFSADLSADNNVVVKPAAGRNVCLIVAGGPSHGNGDQLIGFDKGYVTFDGSNDGTNSRNLTVTTEQAGIEVPFGLNTADADAIVIKNLIIKNLDNGAGNFKYGVVSNDVGGNSFTVDNCQIGSADFPVYRDGVAVWGDWTNGSAVAVVTNNEIHAGARGISTYIAGECQFNNNTIYMHPAATTTYTYAYGIYLSWVKSTEIHNNYIYGLEKTTVATKLIGISSASHPEGSVFSVVNNLINVGAADETNDVHGIGLVSDSDQRSFNVYNNTIVVNENSSSDPCHGIGHIATGEANFDLKNNIIINKHTGNTSSSAIALSVATDTLVSDYNNLISNQNFVNYQGTDYADLTTWQDAGFDVNSVSKAVNFVSESDLHLTGSSVGDFDLAGTPLTTITTDIDGDTRDASYPYMGADEGSVALTPPVTPAVFISEVADPANDYTGRFVELFNHGTTDIDLSTGWKINYYSNANTSPTVVNLTGTIKADSTFVIANNATNFETLFGFAPDMANSTINSNGDDNMELEDPNGNIIDVFGVPGEDGTGTDHEFADGKAVRKATVTTGNSTYDASEWTIIMNVDAPDGFDPGVWPTIIPLEFANAYPSSGTTITIDYTDDVATVDPANYSLLGTPGVTFVSATIDPADASIVTLTAAAEIMYDLVLDTLIDAANTDTAVFYAGITPIGLTNTNNPTGHIENGYTALFNGYVSANDGYNNVWVNDAEDGEYTGTMIFSYTFDSEVAVGDFISFLAKRDEYKNLTELVNPMLLSIVSSGNDPFGPFNITGADIDTSISADTDPAEKWEGQLVKIDSATVLSYTDYQYVLTDDDSITYFMIGDNVDYHFGNISLNVGDTYNITGIVDYNGDYYRINPRDADDIVRLVPPGEYDITETFDTADDVANWRSENSGWTGRAHVDGMLCLSDGGWTFDARRTVIAEPNTFFKATAKIKTVGSFSANPTSQYIYFGIDGLGDQDYQVSCISDDDFTTFTIIGYAVNDTGSLYIAGQGQSGADTVYVDEYSYENNYVPSVTEISSIDVARTIAEGEMVATTGIVTTTTNYGSSGPAYIQDAVAGIAVYNYDVAQNVEIGDEILVIGEIDIYNGLVEIKNTDFIVLSKDNEVEPIVITAADMDGEAFEGMLVTIEKCDTLATGLDWAATEGSNKGFDLKDGNDSTFYCYIDKDTDIDGSPKPTDWPLNITGIVGDYNGAQLLPRSLADFEPANRQPGAFTILNPADSTLITSLDDTNLVKIEVGADSVLALFMNWTESIDPDEGDVVTYQVIISPDGPEEDIITEDTLTYIMIDEERPWSMNGSYSAYVVATDVLGKTSISDTITIMFDFPAPPEIVYADIVLVDGAPKLYAQFNMEFESVDLTNFSIVDFFTQTAAAPTALDSLDSVTVMLSGDLVEDHYIGLAYNGITVPGGTIAATDTAYAGEVLIPFSENHPEDEIHMITDFESDIGSFLDPNWSGSTTAGDASTFAISDEEAFHGSKSGKMTIVDNTATTGGWYVRELYGYPFAYTVKTSSKLMLMVKGTDAIVQMRLSVKDTGYEQGPWVTVSVSEDDWQVVSFDLMGDEAEGWVNGNGIIEGETVVIEGIHIKCAEDKDVVLYFDGFTERQTDLVPVDVTFEVSMAVQTLLGNFNIASDFVDVAGSFNDWGNNAMVLDDSDGDSVYSYTITGLLPGEKLEYKFRINGNDNTAEFSDGGSVRTYTVPDTNSVVFHWYNDQDRSALGIDDMNALPKTFALHQNYPNPFNPITTIKYDLPQEAHVKIMIYDIMGREVRTLVNARQPAGYQAIQWNALDNNGRRVSSGYYIYVMQADKYHKTQKMILLK